MAYFTANLVTGNESPEELAEALAKVQKQLEFMMDGNLNSRNVREIGNWLVGPDYFKARNGQVGISSLVSGGNDIRMWAGDDNPSASPYRVYEDGLFVATDALISGNITMTSGSITWDSVNTDPVATDAKDTAEAIANGTYSGGTFIDDSNIYSPNITGAVITGALIRTSSSGQRIEMDTDGFISYDSSNVSRILISPDTATFGLAGIEFRDSSNNVKGHVFSNSSQMGLFGRGDLSIRSLTGVLNFSGDVDFTDNVDFSSVDNITGLVTGTEGAHDHGGSTGSAGSHNHGGSTGSVGNHNHGIADGTVLMKHDGDPITFSSSGGHSHTIDSGGSHAHSIITDGDHEHDVAIA